MRARTILLGGLGLGAAAAFLFDPTSGRERRSRLRDTASRTASRTNDMASSARRDMEAMGRDLQAKGRHLRQRASDLTAKAKRLARRDKASADENVEQRLHAVSNDYDRYGDPGYSSSLQ